MNRTYTEGNLFVVPLRRGGFGLGLIGRVRRHRRIALGHFFGPRMERPPTVKEVGVLYARDAVLVCRFGDLSLLDGSWKIIGRLSDFDRKQWPMPLFRREELTGRTWLVEYADNDPNKVTKETLAMIDSAKRLAEDSLWGSGAVEIALTEHL